MGELFEVSDLVRVAVEDERTGVAFYSALAGNARSPRFRRLFADLGEQEKYHRQRFERMLAELGPRAIREEYPGQYLVYLQTLTSTRAFPDEQTAVRMAAECKDDAAAVDLASRFERDTLILMNEMRSLVPEKDKPVVDEITRGRAVEDVRYAGAAQEALQP